MSSCESGMSLTNTAKHWQVSTSSLSRESQTWNKDWHRLSRVISLSTARETQRPCSWTKSLNVSSPRLWILSRTCSWWTWSRGVRRKTSAASKCPVLRTMMSSVAWYQGCKVTSSISLKWRWLILWTVCWLSKTNAIDRLKTCVTRWRWKKSLMERRIDMVSKSYVTGRIWLIRASSRNSNAKMLPSNNFRIHLIRR